MPFKNNSKYAEYAYTNGISTYVNMLNAHTRSVEDNRVKILSVIGYLAHECGHIAYTDMKGSCSWINGINKKIDYSDFPKDMSNEESKIADEIVKMAGKETAIRQLIQIFVKNSSNIIDDIFLETSLCLNFPGLIKSAIVMNRTDLAIKSNTLKQYVDAQLDKLSIFLNLCLEYASCGHYFNPEGLENDITLALEKAMPIIDKAVATKSQYERDRESMRLLTCAWGLIADDIKKHQQTSSANNSSCSKENSSDESSEKEQDNQTENNDKGDNSEEDKDSTENPNNEKSNNNSDDEVTEENQENNLSDSNQNGSEKASDDNELGNISEEELRDALHTMINNIENDVEQTSEQNQNTENLPDKEYEPNPMDSENDLDENNKSTKSMEENELSQEKENINKEVENKMDSDSVDNNSYESEIDELLQELAEESLSRKKEEELLQDRKDKAVDLLKGDNVHGSINLKINRDIKVNKAAKIDYANTINECDNVIEEICEEMEDALKDKIARLDKGMFLGKRLSRGELFRHDQRIFERRTIPEETELAVSILIDFSGSMYGERIEIAQKAALILYEYCQRCNVPVFMAGHNSDFDNEVNIYTLADWDSVDDNDKYRIFQSDVCGCNRDGAAMRYCLELLNDRKENKKLFVIISDGAPNDTGYWGDIAKKDIQNIKREYSGMDIHTFAAAIGSDKDAIQDIYQDGFLDITNLDELPKNLIDLVNEFLLD